MTVTAIETIPSRHLRFDLTPNQAQLLAEILLALPIGHSMQKAFAASYEELATLTGELPREVFKINHVDEEYLPHQASSMSVTPASRWAGIKPFRRENPES